MGSTVKLVVMNGSGAGKELLFAVPRMHLVGRGDDCDLRLANTLENLCISRRHCLLDIDPPRLRVRDLGSLNGTFINGKRLGHPATSRIPDPSREDYDLKDGDELALAGLVFQVRISTPVEALERLEVPPNRPERLADVAAVGAARSWPEREPAENCESRYLPLYV
jgi:pSer/pThr/pTyr-binding forkhead associated (FHA) protein